MSLQPEMCERLTKDYLQAAERTELCQTFASFFSGSARGIEAIEAAQNGPPRSFMKPRVRPPRPPPPSPAQDEQERPSLYSRPFIDPISGCRCSPPMRLAGLGIGGVIPNVVAKRRHNSDFVIYC